MQLLSTILLTCLSLNLARALPNPISSEEVSPDPHAIHARIPIPIPPHHVSTTEQLKQKKRRDSDLEHLRFYYCSGVADFTPGQSGCAGGKCTSYDSTCVGNVTISAPDTNCLQFESRVDFSVCNAAGKCTTRDSLEVSYGGGKDGDSRDEVYVYKVDGTSSIILKCL